MKKALRLQEQGANRQALAIYEDLLRDYPGHPDVQHNAGLARFHLDEFNAAESYLMRALSLRPKFDTARSNLVKLWTRMDRSETLSEIAKDPDWVGALDYDASIGMCRHFMLLGDFAVALTFSRRALVLDDSAALARHYLGVCLLRTNCAEEAEPHLRSALEGLPDNPEILVDLARCLLSVHMRRKRKAAWTEARSLLQSAVALAPDSSRFHHELGTVYEEDGEFQKAKASYLRSLELQQDYLPALASLASLSRSDASGQLLDELQAVLSRDLPYPHSERSRAYQSLGKCFDHREDYDKAFSCFVRSNGLLKPAKEYDRARREAYVANLISTYSSDAFTKARSRQPEKPAFIVGMPRSGTTLLEHMLSMHPQVEGAGELPWFTGLERRRMSLHDESGNRSIAWGERLQPAYRDQLRGEYDRILRDINADARIVIDKMPFNFSQVGMILHLYPGARILHTQRDRFDVCLSSYVESFSLEHDWSFDLSDIAHYFSQYEKLMDHWLEIFDGQIMNVRYEDLVMDPEGTIRSVLIHLGLEWDPGCLAYEYQSRSIRTPSKWQVRQPIYRTSIARWKNYRKHLTPLFETFGQY